MPERPEEKVEKIFRGLTALPSLPEAVQKLVELSEKDASPRQFAELISADQGLTAKVLKLVNSAFFGLSKPVSSLTHAASLLGTRTLKSLVLSVSILQLFRRGCAGFDPFTFWRHSVAVALASRKLAVKLAPGLEDELYVAGLLHDAGTALLAQHLPEDYALVIRLFGDTERHLRDIEGDVFAISHAEVGYRLVARWELPKRICECIRYHELTPDELAERTVAADVLGAIDVLRHAEGAVLRQGLGFFDRPAGDGTEAGAAALEGTEPEPAALGTAEIDACVGDLGEEVARVEAVLGARERRAVEAG